MLRRSVPAPVLMRSPPPDTPPANPSVKPVATSMRPACASVMAREVVKEFETASPPPLNTTAPAVSPRFSLRSTCSVPPVITVPPV
ncbi:hypothetical protein D9M68_619910 [compost metagenome]